MREIKFRAWDKNRERWMTDMEISDFNFSRNVSVYQGVAWCQFTGMLDKNSKEIYEGDIVKTHEPNFDDEVFLEVVMFPQEHPDSIMAQTEDNHIMLGDIADNCEIIGNIHENGDLISGGTK